MYKTYAISDLHGMYNLWTKVKDYIDDTDTIYFLGDAADRGPDGLKLMIELLNDPRVIYLLGNHEDIMLDAAGQLMEGRSDGINLWINNGGKETLNSFELLSNKDKKDLLYKLGKLPEKLIYTNQNGDKILLSHAGGNPSDNKKRVDWVWDRDHMIRDWEQKDEDIEIKYSIHGHTPTHLALSHCYISWIDINQENYPVIMNEPSVIQYCDFHKIDIDLGCFFTGKTCLFDLDEMKPIYFELTQEEKNAIIK